MSPAAILASSRRDCAWGRAFAWEDHPRAVALLSNIDMLERVSDQWMGDPVLRDAMADTNCNPGFMADHLRDTVLDDMRHELIAEACANIEDEDYCSDLLDNAPTVKDALQRARKNRLGLMVPPYGEGLTGGEVVALPNGRHGVAL